jgi:hypothetical protein
MALCALDQDEGALPGYAKAHCRQLPIDVQNTTNDLASLLKSDFIL